MKILITSGGTQIPIDKVRSITNMSQGTFGSKIAEVCLEKGHEVCFFRADNSKQPIRHYIHMDEVCGKYLANYIGSLKQEYEDRKSRYKEMTFKTFEQYERGLNLFIGSEKPDVIVLAAAVSDYTVENPYNGKVRSNDLLTIRLTPLPKIINKVKMWAPYAKLVGFKLLVNSTSYDLIESAKKSVVENGCDMVVANDLEDIKNDNHKLTLVFPNGEPIVYQHKNKENQFEDPMYLAKKLVEHIEKL